MSDPLLDQTRSLSAPVAGAGTVFAMRGVATAGRTLRHVASPLPLVAAWQLASLSWRPVPLAR